MASGLKTIRLFRNKFLVSDLCLPRIAHSDENKNNKKDSRSNSSKNEECLCENLWYVLLDHFVNSKINLSHINIEIFEEIMLQMIFCLLYNMVSVRH